jgi:hypothetical protein
MVGTGDTRQKNNRGFSYARAGGPRGVHPVVQMLASVAGARRAVRLPRGMVRGGHYAAFARVGFLGWLYTRRLSTHALPGFVPRILPRIIDSSEVMGPSGHSSCLIRLDDLQSTD